MSESKELWMFIMLPKMFRLMAYGLIEISWIYVLVQIIKLDNQGEFKWKIKGMS